MAIEKSTVEIDGQQAEEIYADLKEQQAGLAQAVGTAIPMWARVEFCLVSIFATTTSLPLDMAAHITANLRTFSSLLDLCHSTVSYALGETPALKHWNSIVEYAKELSGDRNYLAHQPMVFHCKGRLDDVPRPPTEMKIGPNALAHIAGITERKAPLEQSEIEELVKDFQELITCLDDFNDFLNGTAASDEKFHKPISRRRPPRNERLATKNQAPDTPPESSPA